MLRTSGLFCFSASALAKSRGERIQDVAVASANPQEREDEAQPKRLAKLCRNKSSKNATNDENLSVPPNAIMEDWKRRRPHDNGQHHRQFYVRQRRRTIERTAVVAADSMPRIEDLMGQTCLMHCSVMTGLLIEQKLSFSQILSINI